MAIHDTACVLEHKTLVPVESIQHSEDMRKKEMYDNALHIPVHGGTLAWFFMHEIGFRVFEQLIRNPHGRSSQIMGSDGLDVSIGS